MFFHNMKVFHVTEKSGEGIVFHVEIWISIFAVTTFFCWASHMVSRRLTDGSGSWTGRSIGGQNILESAYEEAMGLRESVKSLRDDAT